MSESFASGTTPLPTDTLRVLEVKILLALGAFSGGITGQTGQVLLYTTTDPTADGVLPTDQNSPAIAYKRDGTGSTFTWNTQTHAWT